MGKLTGDWVDAFMLLGRPQPPHDAFPDMHPDDVVLQHSGVRVTAGDVRALQKFLADHGAQRTDRLAAIMRQWPTRTPQ